MNRIFGFEPKIGIALLDHFGSAIEVMNITPKDQSLLPGPHSKFKGMISERAIEAAAKELISLENKHIRFIGQTQEHYPELLKECPDAPIGIYVRSSSPLESIFEKQPCIGIVGTRDISLYGDEWCKKTVEALAHTPEKPLIVSGLALGTDICAHKSAIEHGMQTIGVMATGPETIYPWRHTEFAERLIHTPGCALITDYPPGTAPLAIHFLRRNRIIAGLSQSTILIESKIKGGGMMTCRLAFSYGRDVYALPGRADDIRSQGCNHLIREKIAEPITSTSELVKSLGFKSLSSTRKSTDDRSFIEAKYIATTSVDRVDQMVQILLAIRNQRGITVEDIAFQTSMDYSRVAELTRLLETDGFISIDLLQRCTINIRK